MAEELEVQRESVSKDYWNVVNPMSVQYNYPETRFNVAEDTRDVLDIDAEDFKSVYDTADIHTQREMLKASSNSHALKIAERNTIFNDSSKAIEQDGIATQFMMGAIPALASPTSLLPAGAFFKATQLAKGASRLSKVTAIGGAGAIAGATVNVADEALFDAQGMPTNYVAAGAYGALFGGALGALGGALQGPYKGSVANGITPDKDTFRTDFESDPDLLVKLDDSGNIQLEDIGVMEKSIIDRVPFLGDWLKSDVHTVYQSDSAVMRGLMGRISSATVSLRDSAGKLIPSKYSGMDFKRKLKGLHNNLTQDVDVIYNEARAQGFEGSRSNYSQEVYRVYLEELNRQKKEANKYANQVTGDINLEGVDTKDVTAFKKKYHEAVNKWYEDNPVEFRGNPVLVEGAKAYKIYFDKMLKSGQDLGIKELQGISSNRLYAPRIYDYKKMHKGIVSPEDIKSQVRAALNGDPRNVFNDAEQLEQVASGVAKMLQETSFDLNNLTNSFLVKDLPFETHLKSKKLYLDETKMFDVLLNDFDDIAGMYHYKMGGRQATQFAFGTDNLSDIMKFIRDEHLAKGITDNQKEIQAFERSVKDLLGDLRINGLSDTPGWTFTRNLLTYNSTRMGGGFGGNQFIELSSALVLNGMEALMNKRLSKSLKNTTDLLYSKKKGDEFTQYLVDSGFMEDALHTSRINRFADTEAGFNSGKLESALHWMNDKLMKYNGMRYFMGVMEDYTGAAVRSQLMKGNVDAKRLARWGLTQEDATSLGKTLNEVEFDFAKMSQKQQDQFQLAITRGIEEVVVQGESIHVPAWMKVPDPFKKVIFQFMRFPLIAQETLTRRGMKEDQARFIGSILASTSTYVGLKYLREQAAIASGTVHEIDAKYDYINNKEDLERAVMEAFNYNAPLGMFSSLYNYGAIATGQEELGRDWQGKHGMPSILGPSYGLGEDIIQLIRAGVEGNLNDERSLQRFKAMSPYMNLPLLNEGGKMLIEEYGD